MMRACNALGAHIVRITRSHAEARYHVVGARAFRFVTGFVLAYQLVSIIGQWSLFFGAESLFETERFVQAFGETHISVFGIFGSNLWQGGVFTAAIITYILWALRGGGLLTALTWWLNYSIHECCPGLWDGGDNLISILLVYSVALDFRPRSCEPLISPLRRLFHNAAVLACSLQICLLYFTAGLAKVPGKYWSNGTGLYYVLASEEFGATGFGEWAWSSPTVLAVLTWAPLMMQLAFPWVYFFGRPTPRRLLIVSAIMFHVGILVMMGLGTFAIFMIGAELLLLSDADFAALWLLPRQRGD